MKLHRYITCVVLLLAVCVSAQAVTRKQWKLNLREENEELREQLAELEADYNELLRQISVMDSVADGIFNSLESVSPDTVAIARAEPGRYSTMLERYRMFRPTIELVYPETAVKMTERARRLEALSQAVTVYHNVRKTMARRHTREELSAAVDSLSAHSQATGLTKAQRREVQKLAELGAAEWDAHDFMSEMMAEVLGQWKVIPGQKEASAALKEYILPTIATAYPGKKRFPSEYAYLNSVLDEFTGVLSDYEGNSGKLDDEEQFGLWIRAMIKKLY